MNTIYWLIVCEYHNSDTSYKLVDHQEKALIEAREVARLEAEDNGYELEVIVDNEELFSACTHCNGDYVYVQEITLNEWSY